MRLALDPCDYHPFFRELFRVGGSRFRVGGGMPASKWLTMACGATHELARADAAHPHRHPRLARAAFHTLFPWLEE